MFHVSRIQKIGAFHSERKESKPKARVREDIEIEPEADFLLGTNQA